VWVSPTSGSVVVSVPMSVPDGWFSLMELFESWMSVGASLTATTVMSRLSLSVFAPPAPVLPWSSVVI